jgi:hypothetical protein
LAAVVIGAAVVVAELAPELCSSATAVGEAWAHELVRVLRTNKRKIVGEWPGTMSEARMLLLTCLHQRLDADVLSALARIAIGAARGEWQQRILRPRRRARVARIVS